MSIADKLTTIAENEQRVYDAGKQAQYDEFWDDFQKNGTEYMYYGYAFANRDVWTQDMIEKVKYKNLKANQFSYVFIDNTSITDLSMFTFECSGTLPLNNTFGNCQNLKKCMPINCNKVYNFANVFNKCNALEELFLSGTLKRSGLDLKSSTKLSKESIESVINVLSSTASGQTVILSQTAVDNAFTAEEWEELVNTKMNWTITLS